MDRDQFKSINIRSQFGGGNYFLIWPNISPEILEIKMRNEGILIRNMCKKKDLEDAVRVSIGTKQQMETFWKIYKKCDL